ncbi:hypothetical protein HNY73_003392 [Argiope bruennichi]|uniref:Uncharacterized protein n=1 Tax=Argiope bruennichi TaxID=94029 RepID=A0A8T0FPZ0_ARGBR|nr:hypothetical protein HNY73_003392 [Argiope bruennichi]
MGTKAHKRQIVVQTVRLHQVSATQFGGICVFLQQLRAAMPAVTLIVVSPLRKERRVSDSVSNRPSPHPKWKCLLCARRYGGRHSSANSYLGVAESFSYSKTKFHWIPVCEELQLRKP